MRGRHEHGNRDGIRAKTRFGELLERVARGEEVAITRHDKPVARIVQKARDVSIQASVYDAANIELAQRRSLALGCKVGPLRNAAQRAGVARWS